MGLWVKYNQLGDQRSASVPVPIRDEFLSMIFMLPFAVAHLGDSVSSEVSAVDATPARGGICRADTSKAVAHNLYRLAEQRGEIGRLDWNDEEGAKIPTKMTRPTAQVDDVIRGMRFRATQSWRCGRAEAATT